MLRRRGGPGPIPTEDEMIAIARLLMQRARAGELGLDDKQRPPGIWNTHGWEIRFPLRSYFLNHIQASALALGKVTLEEAPLVFAQQGRLFRRGEERAFDSHSFPTCGFLTRKPAESETRYAVPVTRKAAVGGS